MRTKSMTATALVVMIAFGAPFSSPAWAGEPGPGVVRQETPGNPVFQTGGDYVHFSSTPPPTVSAHGWWLSSDGGKAKVTVELQIKKSGGGWRTVTTGSKTVKQGGGSSRRTNARLICVTTERTTWRSRVDVDIIGEADTPDKLETPGRVYPCGVG